MIGVDQVASVDLQAAPLGQVAELQLPRGDHQLPHGCSIPLLAGIPPKPAQPPLMVGWVPGEDYRPDRDHQVPRQSLPPRQPRLPDPSQPELLLYPGLCRAAMATRRDKGLVLWTMARAMDDTGSGAVDLKRFTRVLVRQRLASGRTLRRHLAEEGEGFWSLESAYEYGGSHVHGRSRPIIRLVSLLRVATMLFKLYARETPKGEDERDGDCRRRISRLGPSYPGRPQAVPIRHFRTRQRARAWLHAVAFGTPLAQWVWRKGKDRRGRSTQVVTPLGKLVDIHQVRKQAKPIARETIEAIEGRSVSTQRRYERAARVRVERNLDLCAEDSEIQVASDAPNTYRNRAEPILGGPARRVTGTLRSRGLLTTWRTTRRRFYTAQAYLKWAQRQRSTPPGATVYIREPGPPVSGRWTCWRPA
jgi:hypothetical protein